MLTTTTTTIVRLCRSGRIPLLYQGGDLRKGCGLVRDQHERGCYHLGFHGSYGHGCFAPHAIASDYPGTRQLLFGHPHERFSGPSLERFNGRHGCRMGRRLQGLRRSPRRWQIGSHRRPKGWMDHIVWCHRQ